MDLSIEVQNQYNRQGSAKDRSQKERRLDSLGTSPREPVLCVCHRVKDENVIGRDLERQAFSGIPGTFQLLLLLLLAWPDGVVIVVDV